MTSLAERADADPTLLARLKDTSVGHKTLAREIGVGETSVRRWRQKHLHTQPHVGSLEEPVTKGSIDVDANGATVNGVVVEEPISTDWSEVFRQFKLDPDQFEVVDDTVRMSTWQQSKRLENGERDIVQLYSYSARFRRISPDAVSDRVVEQWRVALMDAPPSGNHMHRATSNSPESTYLILVADPQLGKKGTEEAVENWKRGILGHVERIGYLAQQHNIERVHVAYMGDETEGVANNYTNQPHTIELNQSKQLELDYDLRVWTMRQVLDLPYAVSASSVISNHGEWTRNGTKDVVTTRNDNASTFVARQVEKFFGELVPYGVRPVDWTIGETTPGIHLNLSGQDTYFSHGYVEKGKGGSTEIRTRNAIERQILGRTEELGDTKLWFMAHYHHAYFQEFEGRTQFGCPALEATRSSEYMLDQYGVWSPSGMLGLLVGTHTERGWSDLDVR